MKLLLVEDNIQLNKALTTLLKRNSYIVDSAFDGEEALIYLKEYQYDCVILDIMLPKIDGLEVLARTRKDHNDTPIILLTAKSTLKDKVTGLDLGADDYLPKPFSTEELLARIRVLTRRKNLSIIKNEDISFGDISVNKNNSSLICGDKSSSLTNKEMAILVLLILAKGNIVSNEQISESAWDIDAYSTSDNVWVYISYLRKKLKIVHSKTKIKTIRYQGYYLEKDND